MEDTSSQANSIGIGWEDVHLDEANRTVQFVRDGIELFTGATGRGYVMDSVVSMLRKERISDALIQHNAGCIAGTGNSGAGESGWRTPLSLGRSRDSVTAGIHLRDTSLSFFRQNEPDSLSSESLSTPKRDGSVEGEKWLLVLSPDSILGNALGMAAFDTSEGWLEAQCRSYPTLGFTRFLAHPDSSVATDWQLYGAANSAVELLA